MHSFALVWLEKLVIFNRKCISFCSLLAFTRNMHLCIGCAVTLWPLKRAQCIGPIKWNQVLRLIQHARARNSKELCPKAPLFLVSSVPWSACLCRSLSFNLTQSYSISLSSSRVQCLAFFTLLLSSALPSLPLILNALASTCCDFSFAFSEPTWNWKWSSVELVGHWFDCVCILLASDFVQHRFFFALCLRFAWNFHAPLMHCKHIQPNNKNNKCSAANGRRLVDEASGRGIQRNEKKNYSESEKKSQRRRKNTFGSCFALLDSNKLCVYERFCFQFFFSFVRFVSFLFIFLFFYAHVYKIVREGSVVSMSVALRFCFFYASTHTHTLTRSQRHQTRAKRVDWRERAKKYLEVGFEFSEILVNFSEL